MDRKFRILRTIATLWKVLAWILLIVGILFSLGILLIGILGSGGVVLRYLGQDPGLVQGAMSTVSGIVGFVGGLIVTIVYFLILYAIGELIDLLLSIEENTRLTAKAIQGQRSAHPYQTMLPMGE
ncbi:MAG: hypothetical protein PVH41_05350 [Anaerolineae bacterium]